MLECANVLFSYGSKVILKNINLYVDFGEIISILGSSGCGKTTLFRLITGLEKIQRGHIYVDSITIEESFSNITYMMQEDLLLPWRNVMSNMMLFAELSKNKKIGKNDARNFLREVNLQHCEELYPYQLSGGMRQRISLARSLLQNRPLMLLDEPFGALDITIREQMYELILNLKKKFVKTIVLVTHDFHDALFLSDRIYLMSLENGIYDNIVVPKNIREDTLLFAKMQNSLRTMVKL